ncbi:MAG: tetratricopeptide repeat protein [Alphaproteobacteria bacterium]|nr:MAG: tetratricopeptide repeat protein [Alphaproteobacteria bacterium]
MNKSLTVSILGLLMALPACSPDLLGKQDFSAPPDSPATLEHSEVNSIFARGLKQLASGDAEAAQTSFSKVLAAEPDNKDALLGLAESNLSLGHTTDALTLYRDLEADETFQARALQGQGLAYLRDGQNALALTKLSEAVDADQSLWRSWNAMGQIYDSQKAWDEANNAYAFGLSQNPGSIALRNNVGMSLLLQDRPEDALTHFEAALNIDPRNKTAASNRQIALAKLGRYAEALEGVNQQERYIALNNIGYIAMLKGDLKRARHYFNLAAEESPAYYKIAEENLKRVEQMLADQSDHSDQDF